MPGKVLVRTDRFIRPVRGLWSAVLASLRILQEITGFLSYSSFNNFNIGIKRDFLCITTC